MGSRSRGFTLVELMITVTLIAILALTLMPLLSGFVGGTEVQVGMNGMVDFLQRARVQASLTGRAHQVRLERASFNGLLKLDRSGSASCCCAGQPGDPFLPSNGGAVDVDVFDPIPVSPGLVIKDVDPNEIYASGRGICFTPDGRVLDPATLLPFESSRFGAGMVAFDLAEHQVEYGAGYRGATGASSVANPGRAWSLLLGYNGLARWEAKR